MDIYFCYPVSQNILSNALCTAALLPELKPAPCFLSGIIGKMDKLINPGVPDLSSHGNNNQTHLN